MTNQEIITAALGKLGIVEAGDSANATDSATALGILNRMMEDWGVNPELDLNWFPQDTLSDAAPLPLFAEKGVIANLALEAAPDFRVTVGMELAMEAAKGKRNIGNAIINRDLDNADMSHLPYGEGRGERYNIESDTY